MYLEEHQKFCPGRSDDLHNRLHSSAKEAQGMKSSVRSKHQMNG